MCLVSNFPTSPKVPTSLLCTIVKDCCYFKFLGVACVFKVTSKLLSIEQLTRYMYFGLD